MSKKRPLKDEPPIYAVEVILQARRTEQLFPNPTFHNSENSVLWRYWDYHLKWEGYPDDENTWEPFDNLQGCEELLERFWEHARSENLRINVPRFIVSASAAWVAQEKKRLSQEKDPEDSEETQPRKAMRRSPAKAGESSKNDSTSEETPKKQPRRSPGKSSNSPRKHTHRQQQNNSSPSRAPPSPTSPVKQTRLKLLLRKPNSPRPEPLPTASHTPLSPPLTPEPDPPRPPDDDAGPPVAGHEYLESEPNLVPNESSIPTSAPHDTWLSAHSGLDIEEPSALALHTPVASNNEAAVWHDSDDFGDRNYFQPEDNLWSII